MPEAQSAQQFLAYQMGTLAYSQVQTPNPMSFVRAAAWHNMLARLGLHVPFFLVHDLGLLLTGGAGQGGPQIAPRAQLLARLRPPEEIRALLQQYAQLLRQIASSEVISKGSAWRLADDIISVILAKILRGLYARWGDRGQILAARESLPADPAAYADRDISADYIAFPRDREVLNNFLRHLISHQFHLLTAIEQIDLDTLRVLGLFQEGPFGSGSDFLDLFQVFSSPEANDIVSFSLELLPSVLEAKRSHGVQTFSIDGYASIERRGNLDSILLTEFAYDEDIFDQKFGDNELYFYGREKQREQEERLHYILVDASASMRGVRSVFARGLALTLIKKLQLKRERIYLRFFDSRLYDLVKVEGDAFGAPYLLCFKSERGRNYTKVFGQLVPELSRLRKEERRSITLYFLTHGQCHIPVPIVESLKRVAALYGVFILPSSQVELDYLPLLDRYHIVDEETLSNRKDRVDKALEIIDEASSERQVSSGG
jgi:hypothetical protein